MGARVRGTGILCRAASGLAGPPLLAAIRADLLHLTYYCSRPPSAPGRLVVTVHDMIHELFPNSFPPDDPTREHKRRCVEAADRVVCVSHSTARDLTRLLGVSPEKISVTHLGFSTAFASTAVQNMPVSREAERPYLLYVGHRGGYKNFNRLLEAYAASPKLRRDFDLIVFGGGPFTQSELSSIDALGLGEGAVRRLSGGDVALACAYAGAHVFVYPSEYEGFGIPPLEAMSCGCAVACSNVSSVPEVVGNAGEYFDPTSVEEIRAAIERIVDDDRHRGALIAAGHERLRKFSWDRCAAETREVYRAALTD